VPTPGVDRKSWILPVIRSVERHMYLPFTSVTVMSEERADVGNLAIWAPSTGRPARIFVGNEVMFRTISAD